MHMDIITWADFEKIDIRTGTITEVSDFSKARNPSYQLKIDFGELGIRKSAAQVVDRYKKEDLVGMQVIAVVNFAPKQIANFFSECLVLGVYTEEKQVILLKPQQTVTNGMKIG
jgi:tRNA-binding protein